MGQCLHYDCEHRNSFGYCRFTCCINPKYGFSYPTSTKNQTEEYIIKQLTNGDKIRSSTNKELVDIYFYIFNNILRQYTDSRQGLLKWLEQEYKNDL